MMSDTLGPADGAVNHAAQRRLNEEIKNRVAETAIIDDNCHSYFKTASGKVTTQWPGYLTEYRLRTSRVNANDLSVCPLISDSADIIGDLDSGI